MGGEVDVGAIMESMPASKRGVVVVNVKVRFGNLLRQLSRR